MNSSLVCSPRIFREKVKKFGGQDLMNRALDRLIFHCESMGHYDLLGYKQSAELVKSLCNLVLNDLRFNILHYLLENDEATEQAHRDMVRGTYKIYVEMGDVFNPDHIKEYAMLQYVQSALFAAITKYRNSAEMMMAKLVLN